MYRIDCEIDGCDQVRYMRRIDKGTLGLCLYHVGVRQRDKDRKRVNASYVLKRAKMGQPASRREASNSDDIHDRYFSYMMLSTSDSFPTGGVLPWVDVQETLDWGYFPKDLLMLNMRSHNVYGLTEKAKQFKGHVQLELHKLTWNDPDYPPQKLVMLEGELPERAQKALKFYAAEIAEWDKINNLPRREWRRKHAKRE